MKFEERKPPYKNGSIACLAAAILSSGLTFAVEDEPAVDGKPLSQVRQQLRSENRGFHLRTARALSGAPFWVSLPPEKSGAEGAPLVISTEVCLTLPLAVTQKIDELENVNETL